MFNLSFGKAIELCGVSDFAPAFNPEKSAIVLFSFDGTPSSLYQYLYLMFETDCIVVVSPRHNQISEEKSFYDCVIGMTATQFVDNKAYGSTSLRRSLYENNIKLVLPTSGTTSAPKFVCFTADQIAYSARSIASSLDLDRGDIGCGYLPLDYTFGLSVLHSHLSVESRFFLPPPGSPLISVMRDARCSHHYFVPSMMQYLKKYRNNLIENGAIKMIAQAGGPLSLADSEDWFFACGNAGVEFVKMYGQTECGPRISRLRGCDFMDAPASVGRPLANTHVSVAECNNEIMVSSDAVAHIWFEERDGDWLITHQSLPFATGDYGRIDNGFIYVDGRLSRTAKIQGIRLSLELIEMRLKDNFGCEMAALDVDGIIIIVPTQDVNAKSVKEFVAHSFNIPPRCINVKSKKIFSLNRNMKIDYQTIRDRL